MSDKKLIVCQDWLESESGWGARPDGHTLHLTFEDRDAYVAGYNATWNNRKTTPSVYTRATGPARQVEATAEQVLALRGQHDQPMTDDHWRRFGIWGHPTRLGPEAADAD